MTLKEIAAEVGVSVSTVSRVVNSNNTKAASPEVRDKIWKIVRERGYTPNQNAQTLKSGLLADRDAPKCNVYLIFARKVDEYVDPFFTELMHAIEKAAFARKYPLQTITTDLELGSIRASGDARHSAAIILGQINSSNLESIRQQFRHLVYISLNALPEGSNVDQVLCSGYKAARAAVTYLNSLGHTRIAYIGETRNEERYEGYLDEMKHLGIQLTDALVYQTPLSPESGHRCAMRFQGKELPFSAIFCANDDTAIGVMRALSEQGRRVPEDVSVIGVDDIEMSRYTSPMLTTIHIPIEEMGVQATKVLFDRIEGGHKTPMKVKFPCSLSPRESCLPPKRK